MVNVEVAKYLMLSGLIPVDPAEIITIVDWVGPREDYRAGGRLRHELKEILATGLRQVDR